MLDCMTSKTLRDYGDPDLRKIMAPLIEGTEITTVDQANDAHRRIKNSLKDAIGLGKFLVGKKAEIGHGGFGQWIEENLVFKERTARRYMNLYEQRSLFSLDETDSVTDLGISRAYKMMAKTNEKKVKGQKKEIAKMISISTSCRQFVDAIALLKSIDAQNLCYPHWIEILEEVISELKIKASALERTGPSLRNAVQESFRSSPCVSSGTLPLLGTQKPS